MSEEMVIDSGLSPAGDLRPEAERRLHEKETAVSGRSMTEADVRALVHELQVHQIELEIQNEELLRAQAAAQEISEKYYDLFDFAPVGYFLWDHAGKILEVNLAGAALLGLDRNVVVQKRFGHFVAAENRAAFAAFCARVLTTGAKQTCEVRLPGGGQPAWVLVEGIAAGDPARERHCLAAVIDITQQKRADELAALNRALQSAVAAHQRTERALTASEDRLRTLIEQASDGVFVSDPHGRYVDVNSTGCRMLGYSREELLGLGIADVIEPEEAPRVVPELARLREGEVVRGEWKFRRKDGSWFFGEVSAKQLSDGRFQAFLRDITERKQAEDALRLSQERLALANETLEQRVAERTAEAQWRANQLQRLAAQMAQTEERERRRLSQVLHDHLQQLLVAVKLRLGAACRRVQDEQAATAINEALGLVDETITESRSLSKELSPPVLYDGGLAAALEWLGRETEKKHKLPVTVDVAPEMEPEDLTTKVFVFQAARELILNAVKHAQASSLKIRLSRIDGERLQVVIEDDGIGFETNGVNTKDHGGGFGLFSIRERLDVIGGQLTLASSPLEGTKATIIAPCTRSRPAERPASALAASSLPRPPAASDGTHRIRVLLADDHPVLRKGLADVLMEHPDLNLVGEAKDGQEAMEIALQVRPDVVLMDITMPRMDGIEATRSIKRSAPEVSVIGLSMHETEEMVAAMTNAGADEYLTKTAPLEDLVAAIKRRCPRR